MAKHSQAHSPTDAIMDESAAFNLLVQYANQYGKAFASDSESFRKAASVTWINFTQRLKDESIEVSKSFRTLIPYGRTVWTNDMMKIYLRMLGKTAHEVGIQVAPLVFASGAIPQFQMVGEMRLLTLQLLEMKLPQLDEKAQINLLGDLIQRISR